MTVFVCRLVPPRPDFAQTMSPAEAAGMGEHMRYWSGLLQAGRVLVYGPVADPAGIYGLAVVEADDMATVDAITSADPVILAGLGCRYECAPMLQAVLHPKLASAA